jgi:hypothetical protein
VQYQILNRDNEYVIQLKVAGAPWVDYMDFNGDKLSTKRFSSLLEAMEEVNKFQLKPKEIQVIKHDKAQKETEKG